MTETVLKYISTKPVPADNPAPRILKVYIFIMRIDRHGTWNCAKIFLPNRGSLSDIRNPDLWKSRTNMHPFYIRWQGAPNQIPNLKWDLLQKVWKPMQSRIGVQADSGREFFIWRAQERDQVITRTKAHLIDSDDGRWVFLETQPLTGYFCEFNPIIYSHDYKQYNCH